MEQLVDQVVQAVRKAGLVEVEVSARHVHLSQEDMETLFGSGATLHPKRPLRNEEPVHAGSNPAISYPTIIWLVVGNKIKRMNRIINLI